MKTWPQEKRQASSSWVRFAGAKRYDYGQKVSSVEELQFSEATLVTMALANPATDIVGALAASSLTSSHVPEA